MKIGIEVRIDVTKIPKERIYVGEKGKYLTMTTFIDTEQEDQYGNHGFISPSTTKEEREQGEQTPILGNCKVFYKGGGKADNGSARDPAQRQEAARSMQGAPNDDDFLDDCPF
jgi:hypothetical protein